MISRYNLNEPALCLKSDLAGEKPLYIYWSFVNCILLYSNSITNLLNDCRVIKPLKVSDKGLSFLLQSKLIPPPLSVYANIYILGVGDTAKIFTSNKKINIKFTSNFPFYNSNRQESDQLEPDENNILNLIAESTIRRMDSSKESFLFHSAGKDSNTIALALAEAGYQDKITLVTHKAEGVKDESSISSKIAKQLGFNHKVLSSVDFIKKSHIKSMDDFFSNSPFPCCDTITLAYSHYGVELPDLKESNIIDGGGNDSYMGTPPSDRENIIIPFSKLASKSNIIRSRLKSESLFLPLFKTPVEWFGISGLSFSDTIKLLPSAFDVHSHWQEESQMKSKLDLFDLKTSILTPIISSEQHIRKVRNFAASFNSNLILPFMDEEVAKYFFKFHEKFLFDRKTKANKLILRKILNNYHIINSDKIGKMGYTYDIDSFVEKNLDLILREIETCIYWNKKGRGKLINNFKNNLFKPTRNGVISRRSIFNIFIISIWLNKNKYTN